MLISALTVLAAVTVSDTDGLLKALDAVAADAAAPHEIVLKPGRYFVPRTIELKGGSVSGLALRAERRGTAELNGGCRLAGWKKEADSDFWYADVPGFVPGGEFFRMLVKDGRWVELATYPGRGRRFEHAARFTAALLPNLVGHWSRKPTDDENRLMPYAVADLPDAMDLENADVHLFHMWDDSLCRVESVDRAKHVLRTLETPNWPMGAQEKFEYEILNVREGAAPGEWYLDRRKGRVFYRPLPGEDVTKLDFVIPNLATVLRIADAKDVTLDGIVVSGSGPTVKNRAGYGGCGVAPAVEVKGMQDLVLKGVRIANVGGIGLGGGGVRFRATDCDFVFSGACAVFLSGCDNVIENCRITDAGKIFRGSSGTFISGQRVTVRKNEFARIPYSGIIGFGDFNRFEGNDIHHVMQVLHDGAAIYGLHVHGVMRGNSVRDVVALGKGFGVHAYYADEGSHDSVIEDNYAEGMPVPIHNHMTSGIVVRNNRLVNTNGDFCLSFERSIKGVFSNNTVICGGELQTKWLDSVPVWSANVANGRPWNPARPQQPKKEPLAALRAKVAPKIDGMFAEGEWPGDFMRIDVTPDRRQTGYSSELVRFMWDDENLYVSMLTANFGSGSISLGSTWGRDDGVKLDFRNGREIAGFNDGTTSIRPESLAKAVRIVALGKGRTGHSNPNLARYEMAIPWSALGVKPRDGLELPFNAMSFMSEHKVMKCWDGLDADPKLQLRQAPSRDVLDWVDTKVGTDMGGNTHPGALWPFGMVQPGPDTTAKADGDYQSDCSGYRESHRYLMGFTQTHLSGTGCTDLMDFLLMPFTGADPDPAKRLTRKMDKRNEKGRPGHYTVTVEDGGILCELTASKRVAYHRYTSVTGGTLKVLLDAQAGTYAWWRRNSPEHRVRFAESTYDERTAVFEGHNRVNCWNDNRDVFAKIAFSRRPDAVRELAANGRNGRRFVLDFRLPPKGFVVAKAAISSVDAAGARANFAADPEGFDFDARLADCRAAWRAELGRVVAAGDETRLRNFYAALYHTMVQPNLFSDVDGRARFSDQQWGSPFTGKVLKAEGHDAYTTFSTWDTFRATHPWYTIFNPGVVDGFCKSMMLSYAAIGKLPIWQMFGGENYCMPGVHSIPVIADAMLKGLTDVDPQAAAKAMDVSQVLRCAEEPAYDKLGYWAYETAGASVSRTLESGIDDYATMKVAELAGDAELARRYARRADYYRNLFDPATGCMRARSRKGSFREPFDPYKQKPTAEDIRNNIPNDYTEGGAWQYAFHVLQDPSGLVKLHGGPDRFGDALEKLFTDNTEVSADRRTGECSGRLGQFALGNEHDQHVPYLFQAANRPWRTEEIVRELCDRYFRPTPDGLCGNDDCGQISAWYVFACLGFYPVNPVGGDYFLGAPQLSKMTLRIPTANCQLPSTNIFTVVAKGLSEKNKYVKAVTLNGKPHEGMILRHADIVRGGELVFEMSDVPRSKPGRSARAVPAEK